VTAAQSEAAVYGSECAGTALQSAFATGETPVAVYGLGKMGLPLAAVLAEVTAGRAVWLALAARGRGAGELLADDLDRDISGVSRDLDLLAVNDIVEYETEGRRKIPHLKHQTVVAEPVA